MARIRRAAKWMWATCGALILIPASTLAVTVVGATGPNAPSQWVVANWGNLLTATVAFLVVHYVRRIDRKFDVLFEWKKGVDTRLGVHDQVWSREDGCGSLWVHHREDGGSVVHFRGTDQPGVCGRCAGLQGHELKPDG